MNDGPDPQPSTTQGVLSLLVILGFLIGGTLLAIGLAGDGPWWLRTLRGAGAYSLVFAVATFALGYLANRARDRTGLVREEDDRNWPPTPGKDDQVFYVEWERRGDGCLRLDVHDGHVWFWQAVDRPDAHGALWCEGVRPR